MKIAILSRKANLHSTQRLVEAAAQRGHEVHVIDPLRCYMNISPQRPTLHHKGALLDEFDAVLSRRGIGLPMTAAAHAPDDTGEARDMVGGAPVVIKLVEGTQGIGVVLAETTQAAEGL